MKLDLVFQGAVEGAIGGNAVLARVRDESRNFQYLFDFGVDSDRYRAVQKLGLEPSSLEDYFHRRLIREFDLSIRACFISHAHPDHCMALKALCNSKYSPFPVWASKTTSRIIGGGINFTEIALDNDPIAAGKFYEDRLLSNNFNARIIPYPVDHDIPGACAYFLQTDRSLVTYTGDFRDHGLLSGLMQNQFWHYANNIAGKRTKILITEGTNFGLAFSHNSDLDFQSRIRSGIESYKGELFLIAIKENAIWDILATLHALESNSTQRRIVLSHQISKFWAKISQSFEDDYRHVVNDPLRLMIERYLRPGKHKVIDFASESAHNLLREIATKPGEYLIFATKKEALKIMDFVGAYSGKGGGCCIYNASAGEEGSDDSISEFASALADLGFSLEDTNSIARGHISPHRLVEVIRLLQPQRIILMHTLRPTGLKDFLAGQIDCDIETPQLGKSIDLE